MTTEALPTVESRPMERKDITPVIEMDNHLNAVYDDHVQRTIAPEWTMTPEKLVQMVGQRRDKELGTYATTTYVVTEPAMDKKGGIYNQLIACFTVELRPKYFHLVFLTFDQSLSLERMCHILSHIEGITKKTRHKRALIHVRDGQWSIVRAFQEQKREMRLVPSYFENGDDAYRFEYSG